MKKQILAGLFALTTFYAANAQRHIKGIKGIDVLVGAVAKGFSGDRAGTGKYAEIGYNHYLTSKWYFNTTLQFESGKVLKNFKLSSYSINPSINYTFFNTGNWLFLSFKGGCSLYYDRTISDIPESKLIGNYKANYLNYGAFGGLESEVFLSDRISWLVNLRQNYNFGYRKWLAIYIGTGLRFNIH